MSEWVGGFWGIRREESSFVLLSYLISQSRYTLFTSHRGVCLRAPNLKRNPRPPLVLTHSVFSWVCVCVVCICMFMCMCVLYVSVCLCVCVICFNCFVLWRGRRAWFTRKKMRPSHRVQMDNANISWRGNVQKKRKEARKDGSKGLHPFEWGWLHATKIENHSSRKGYLYPPFFVFSFLVLFVLVCHPSSVHHPSISPTHVLLGPFLFRPAPFLANSHISHSTCPTCTHHIQSISGLTRFFSFIWLFYIDVGISRAISIITYTQRWRS